LPLTGPVSAAVARHEGVLLVAGAEWIAKTAI
jgi:hypothetical protein